MSNVVQKEVAARCDPMNKCFYYQEWLIWRRCSLVGSTWRCRAPIQSASRPIQNQGTCASWPSPTAGTVLSSLWLPGGVGYTSALLSHSSSSTYVTHCFGCCSGCRRTGAAEATAESQGRGMWNAETTNSKWPHATGGVATSNAWHVTGGAEGTSRSKDSSRHSRGNFEKVGWLLLSTRRRIWTSTWTCFCDFLVPSRCSNNEYHITQSI